jgi:hypothetical protein
MKKVLSLALPLLLATSALGPVAHAEDQPPGAVDVTRFFPADLDGGRVSIDLQGALLTLAAQVAKQQEPEAADMLSGLKQVRVNVVDLKKNDAAALTKSIASGRKSLEDSGWSKIVSVDDGNKGDNVAIHVKTKGEESIEGLCITVIGSDKEAVFVNLVGDFKPEKLAKLGAALDIPGLKKAAQAADKPTSDKTSK